MINKYVQFIDRINSWVFNFIAIVFGIVTLLTIYQVFARYVLKSPLVWSEAIVRYSMVWVVLLGTAIALRKGMLISVEVLLFLVSKKIKKILQVLIMLVNIVFLVLLVKYGLDIMSSLAHQKTGSINIPVSWIYAAIPAGSFLGLLNCTVILIELFTKKNEEGQEDGGTVIH
ncbi:TRAP transporter small permease [Alkalihalobacterium alkalinitrilicum]|uniref:TRAP transporter small permease n=1 Tax=Alkalihalobacterium alkalinitrilicum TaxID=427920 RepID=UPI0009950C51|nr:TRAP transporter small permease [Alkalihalobacterium alkalinitrilicum]